MSLTDFVDKNSRIYANDPTAALTDIVGINHNYINPLTPKTVINDNTTPLSVVLSGASRVVNKNIKLINGNGAVVQTIAGTIVLDSENTEVDVIYDNKQGIWCATTPGLMIPATQKQAAIYSSGSDASSAFLGFVNQGGKNSLGLSADGEVLGSGGSGYGLKAENAGNGVIWVLKRDGYNWVETHKLTSNIIKSGSQLGQSVATNNTGSVMVGGAPNYTTGTVGNADYRKGAIVVFEKQPNDTWKETAFIVPVTPQLAAGANYDTQLPVIGDIIKMNGVGDILVIGTRTPSGTTPILGYVWIYARDLDTATWSLLQILDAQTYTGDGFGTAFDISADGSTIVTGIPGFDSTYDAWDDAKGSFITWSKTEFDIQHSTTISNIVMGVILDGCYFIFQSVDTGNIVYTYYVWYSLVLGANDPSISNATGINIDIHEIYSALQLTIATKEAIESVTDGAFVTVSTVYEDLIITNNNAGYVIDSYDAIPVNNKTNFTFNATTSGAFANGYMQGIPNTVIGDTASDGIGSNITLNLNGKIMVMSSNNDIRVYSRTSSNWALDTTQLLDVVPTSLNQIALDINMSGDTIIAGASNYPTEFDGRVFILTKTNNIWTVIMGPIGATDTPISTIAEFGSGVAISGSGNSAIIGGKGKRNNIIGVSYKYLIDATLLISTLSPTINDNSELNMFIWIHSPKYPDRHYVIWFSLYAMHTIDMTGWQGETYTDDLHISMDEIDGSVIGRPSVPTWNDVIIPEIINIININPDFSEIVTAAPADNGDPSMFKITSNYVGSGTNTQSSTAVYNRSYTTQGFDVTEITAGEDEITTGAIWSFA